MAKEKREVLTVFTDKYNVDDPDSLDESQKENNIFPIDNISKPRSKPLFKGLVFTAVALGLLILLLILLNI